jgi:hypothetical protein
MAKLSKDTVIGVMIAAAETPFTGAQDISVSGVNVATVETTAHGSTFDRNYIAGLVDYGEISFTVEPAENDLITNTTALGYCNANLRTQITMYTKQVGGVKASFPVLVTNISESHPVDGKYTVSVSAKVVAAPTVTDTTP